MARHSSYSLSKDFEVFAEVGNTSKYITLTATAEYDVESDDPAYDSRSGNSITMQWCPETSVELDDVYVAWSDDTDDLGTILKESDITGDFTLHFSYDEDDMCGADGEDNRSTLGVTQDEVPDIMITLKSEISTIVQGFAESMDIDPEDP